MVENLTKYLKQVGVKDDHVAQTIAHDVVMDERARGYEYRKAKLLAYNYFERVEKVEEKRYVSLDYTPPTDSGEHPLYEVIQYDDSNERKAEIQDQQRQLIENLVDGSDERTRKIVQTFLESDKPTISNVAAKLGLHKQVVSRSVKRLARNYSENLYGEVSDYITA